jgi:hypothetical protein
VRWTGLGRWLIERGALDGTVEWFDTPPSRRITTAIRVKDRSLFFVATRQAWVL